MCKKNYLLIFLNSGCRGLILKITQKSMIVTQVWGWREMWGEWGEGRYNTEPTQYWISHRNRRLLHRSGGDGRCGGSGGKDVTILNQLNIEYHTEIDDCYTGLGVTGDVGGVGGRTSQYWTNLILKITQKSMIVTQVWGWREMWGEWGEGRYNTEPTQYWISHKNRWLLHRWREMWGEWGEGRHNTEPTQYWISHRNRWLLHRSGGGGRCGGSGGKDVTILNQLNIEYHTEIDDCYTGLGVTGDVGGVGGRTSQYWTYSILNITQKSMIVTQVWSDGRCGGSGGKDVTILNQLNIEYHTEIDDCYTGLGWREMWGEWGEGRHNTEPT